LPKWQTGIRLLHDGGYKSGIDAFFFRWLGQYSHAERKTCLTSPSPTRGYKFLGVRFSGHGRVHAQQTRRFGAKMFTA
jgi:hypothetical protein